MEAGTLYHIMDYSGNYYRTDRADQLVTAAGEQDAAVFTFAQANSRICVGKKAAFYCMVPLEDKTGNETAEAITEGKEDMFIFEAQEKKDVDEYISTVKELTYDEITEQVEKNAASYDFSEMDWAEYLTHFAYLVSGLKDYREELTKRLSDIDQKICDILHYIELCETNDEEAVDLVELLRVCRENRRDIKDELQRTEYFQSNLGTNANASKAKQALKCIKGLASRKYKPRKYDELFENCIQKDKCLQRDDIYEAKCSYENRKQKIYLERIMQDEGGEEIMIEERKDTPFDGKENDWLLFARQQAEFYRNARQYITNLQLDIKAVDTEIEDTLSEIEEVNCNVAQGYKMFKRLKELRLERKRKSKELNCLYTLTDYIDCDALADACESNLTEIRGIVDETEQRNTFLTAGGEQEEIPVAENMNEMAG